MPYGTVGCPADWGLGMEPWAVLLTWTWMWHCGLSCWRGPGCDTVGCLTDVGLGFTFSSISEQSHHFCSFCNFCLCFLGFEIFYHIYFFEFQIRRNVGPEGEGTRILESQCVSYLRGEQNVKHDTQCGIILQSTRVSLCTYNPFPNTCIRRDALILLLQ